MKCRNKQFTHSMQQLNHCRNPRDFYPLYFFHSGGGGCERSVTNRNPLDSNDAIELEASRFKIQQSTE